MSLFAYLHDKLFMMLLHVSGMLILSLFLLSLGNGLLPIVLIAIVWGSIFFLYLGLDYYKRNRYFHTINTQMSQLEKPYLIHELMEKTWRYEDDVYKEILRKSSASAMTAITELEAEQKEYREFIEGWIHEVKLPITSIHLATAELERESAANIQTYLLDLENQVDQALFYARSDYVHQDYLIQEVDMQQLINELIKKNKYLLIQHHMQVSVTCEDHVRCDKKWITFIVNQLVINAVKYKKAGAGSLTFSTVSTKEATKLFIKDTGIGIKAHELPRIFDKGYTGTNGRHLEKSTGMGLYLCQKLCKKLGIGIQCESVEQESTTMIITFPKNSYLSDLSC